MYGLILFLCFIEINGIMADFLLSICIPTYNRAAILDGTLECLLSDPAFDGRRIEVVVSDNCSTDNTEEVVRRYPGVCYFRNEENIRDANFTRVLQCARGRYLKLFNDTMRLRRGMLGFMLSVLERECGSGRQVWFYQNNFVCRDCEVVVCSPDELLKCVSFAPTWIANFGVWREDFERLGDWNRYVHTQFLQVDWSYRLVGGEGGALIVAADYFEIASPKRKGGYNVFDVFVNNYLGLLKVLGISWWRRKVEKQRLMRHFIVPFYMAFVRDKGREDFAFDCTGQYRVILGQYWYEPSVWWFYGAMVYLRLRG